MTDPMTRLGHSKLETTQIYAASVSVIAMEFGEVRCKRRDAVPHVSGFRE